MQTIDATTTPVAEESELILSLLNESQHQAVLASMADMTARNLRQYPMPPHHQNLPHYLAQLIGQQDQRKELLAILMPVCIEHLDATANSFHGRQVRHSALCPMIAVLPASSSISSPQLAMRALQQGFDAVMAEPFSPSQLNGALLMARNSFQYRYYQQRYHRLRDLCREMNQHRRVLKQKINRVCTDLVQSHADLGRRLRAIEQSYTFQENLMGEYDLGHMLRKAIKDIRAVIPDCSAAIYLCSEQAIVANLHGQWECERDAPVPLEDILERTVIHHVLEHPAALIIADGNTSPEIPAIHRPWLKGVTVMALPICLEGVLIGVVVLSRRSSPPFSSRDQSRMTPLLRPLARAIVSLHQLEILMDAP